MNKINELIINIFNNLKNHISIIIEDGKIISLSKNVYEILNFKDDEIIGKDIKYFFTDESNFLDFKNNLEAKERKNFKIKLKTKHENIKIFDTVLVEFGKNKNLLILKDITEDIKKETLNKILYKISNFNFNVKNIQELFEEIHKLLKDYIYSENFYISLIDESGDYIYFPYFVDLKDEKPPPRKRRRGITEYILEHRKPVLLNKEEIEKLREEGKLIFYGTCPEYYIGAPLKVFDKLIGVIALQIYDKNISYTKDDLDLISFISEHISYSIERIRDEEEKLSLIKNLKGFVFTLTYENENVNLINIDGNFEEITGYKKEELLENEKVIKSLIYKEDYEKVRKLFLELIELKTKTLIEILRIITKNGETKWISINLSILRVEIPQVKIIQGIVTDITDSIKTKEELFESEMRFKRIFDNSKDIIYRYSLYPKRGFEYVNDIVTEITGYTPEDHYNDPDLGLKIVHPEDRSTLKKVMLGEVRGPAIFRWIRKDGKIIYIEQNNWFVKDEKGNIVAIEGIGRDITERKILEESLRESEKKFRFLFEYATIGITLTDKNGELLYCNPKWEEIMGYKFEELKNVKWMDLTYPEDIEEDLEKFNKLIKGEIYSYSLEKRAIRKDKKVIWINLKVVRVDDQDGNFLFEIAMIEDITERKMLEKFLAESEKRYRLFFEKNPLGVVIGDFKDNNFINMNEVYLKLLGYTKEELQNLTWKDITHPDDWEKQEKLIEKLINREIDSFEIEKRYIRKDGTIFWGHLFASAIYDENNNFLYAVEMLRDKTEEKELKEEIEESRIKLSRSLDNILNLITKITEMKDPYTLGHQAKVAYMAIKIAEKLNLNEDIIQRIRLASFLHDIGKLTIPTEVLNKGGKFSENEYLLVKEHSKNGYEIIKRVEYLTPVADIVLQHHERLDGSGYPLGLKDDEILLEARIIAVCDVFEAMTSHRPYRPAFSINDALKELKENKGILYDPIVVDAFEELIINKEIDINFSDGRNKS